MKTSSPFPRKNALISSSPPKLSLTFRLKSDKAPDGKSLLNPPPQTPSEAYTTFPFPIQNGQRGGFDIHVYFLQTDAAELEYATALHERIRRECTVLPPRPSKPPKPSLTSLETNSFPCIAQSPNSASIPSTRTPSAPTQ